MRCDRQMYRHLLRLANPIDAVVALILHGWIPPSAKVNDVIRGMYLGETTRKKDGKVHRYWSLVRSVRVGRRVIQQTVAHLGELDEAGRIEARGLARHLIGAPEEAQLFDDGSRDVAVPVRLKGIRIERSRQFGDVYLG